MDLDQYLKQQIKRELRTRGKSQAELAKELGLSQAALSNVLAGKRKLLTVNATRVLEALGLELMVQPKTKN